MRGAAPGTAVVTGASAGIGRELARGLAARGHDLVLVARSRERLELLAEEVVAEHGIAARTLVADLAEEGAGEAVLRAVEREEGRPVDTLVNSAGAATFGPFTETPVDETLHTIRLNVVALTALTRLFLPGMQERGRGRILNVSSTAGFQPGPLMSVYYATKAYVLHFSEGIADELRDTGITVTALCPGPTRTEFHGRAGMERSGLLRDRLMMDSATVARAGLRGMQRGKPVVVPGLFNKLGLLAPRLLPRTFVARAVRRIQAPRGGA